MEVDYIIVGFGLAGLAFARTLEEHQKSYVVFEDDSQTSSGVAGGIYNPVVLKRFNAVWDVSEQLKFAIPFYKKIEKQFSKTYDYPIPIKRILQSTQEQNNWVAACDKLVLSNFMDPTITFEKIDGIKAQFGFGNVKHTGRIDVKKILNDYRAYLKDNGQLITERFHHNKIKNRDNDISYKNITARKVVFCEGFGIKENPFFNRLPLEGAKGELLTIHAPTTSIKALIKSSFFILPIGNNYYKVGATFNWADKTNIPTKEARVQIEEKLANFFEAPYTVTDQHAGVRPTVKDRRPLIGIHPNYKNIAILNGLGTRGVMIGPTMAKELYFHLEKGSPIRKEVDINRFL